MSESTTPPPIATQTDPIGNETKPTSEKQINLSVAQALTIGSVVLATVMTIAYAIASFMQTQHIVDELKESNKKVSKDIDKLNDKVDQLSHQIDQKTFDLTKLIVEKKSQQ